MADRSKRSKTGSPARQDTAGPPRLEAFASKYERHIVLALCLLAALRVFFFSAAFPPFCNVDEREHFDTVCHYARGEVPDRLVGFSNEAIDATSLYTSPEYRLARGVKVPVPIWSLPPEQRAPVQSYFADKARHWTNTEATQPPVYYALAAVWYKLGTLASLRGGFLFYWVRFMNAWLYPLLMWCVYACAAYLFPRTPHMRIGVPLLLAFFPQDVYYAINNDVLSALLFGLAFYLLLRIHRDLPQGWALYAMAGLSSAAAILTKFSNAAIVAVLAVVAVAAVLRLRREGRLTAWLPRLALLCVACAAPVAAWLIRNAVVLHDWTGTVAKTNHLGWHLKSLDTILPHPIFSPQGAYIFVRDLISSFWRGEFHWRGSSLAMPAADALYLLTTLLFLTAALLSVWKHRKDDGGERFVAWVSIAALALSAAGLAAMSLIYDFAGCYYPSETYPYVTSGRLILGCLAPFLLLYVSGLDWLMARFRIGISRLGILLILVLAATYSEIALSTEAFGSPFNWFHMR